MGYFMKKTSNKLAHTLRLIKNSRANILGGTSYTNRNYSTNSDSNSNEEKNDNTVYNKSENNANNIGDFGILGGHQTNSNSSRSIGSNSNSPNKNKNPSYSINNVNYEIGRPTLISQTFDLEKQKMIELK